MNFLQKLNLKTDKALLLAFAILGVVVLVQKTGSSAPSQEAQGTTPEATEGFEVDTMIPAGHLLIPLELSNAESLAALSGQFAVVDLYVTGEKSKQGLKIATAVKLLRAPLNPNQFAVLVREEESRKIVTQEGPFFAALKNPKTTNKAETKNRPIPLTIQYGE